MKLVLVAILLVAGCISQPSETIASETNSPEHHEDSPVTSPPKPMVPQDTRIPLPSAVNWNTCSGAGATGYSAESLNDPPVPEGYGFDEPINGFYLHLARCERMSIGPFERGPVFMVIDGHSNYETPANCKGGATRYNVMSNWWISDAEIAAYLAGLGIPAKASTIEVDPPTLEPPQVTWTWETAPGSTSTITFTHSGQLGGTAPFLSRFFWFSDNTVAYLDYTESGPYDANSPVAGIMGSPSAFAPEQPLPYAAFGTTSEVLGLEGNLRWFGDLECEYELS